MLDPNKSLGFYPDILHRSRGSWRVEKSEPIEARVDLKGREAFVPEALTEIDRNIQNHEYGHVKISRWEDLDETDLGKFRYFLEEVRVNLWCLENGIEYMKAYDGFAWGKMPRPDDRFDAALQWLQTATYILWRDPEDRPADLSMYFADCQDKLSRLTNDVAVLVEAVNSIRGDLKRANRNSWAEVLAKHFAKPKPAEKPPEEKEDYKKEREEAKEAIERAGKMASEREQEAGKIRGGESDRLGGMKIHRHLTKHKPGKRVAMPSSSSEFGFVPTQFGRKAIDGKLFRHKRSSGAVVIDCSGSMSWNWDELKRLVANLPNLLIVKYQGLSGEFGYIGKMCILAQNGRWSPPEVEPGDNWANAVDLEALTWASKATDGPIVWLSDGGVAENPRGNAETVRLCDALMKKRGIVRTVDQKACQDYLRKRTANVFLTCDERRPTKGRMK